MPQATLIQALCLTGSRKADGTANASGRVWAYTPIAGSTSPASLYADAEASIPLSQPVMLDASGKVPATTGGPFINAAVRLVVEQVVSAGVYSTLSDYIYAPVNAAAVGVANTGWSGVNPDGTTTAGGDTTLDAVLSSLKTSTGGIDGLYQESAGAVTRTIQSKFEETWVSVKDFGARGDGVAIDTTAFQAAINRVAALGGGIVYIPPTSASYLIDATLTNTSNGVSLRGAGRGSSILKFTSTTANGISWSGCSGWTMEGFQLICSSTSTGYGIVISGCNRWRLTGVDQISPYFSRAVSLSGTNTVGVIDSCYMDATANSGDRGLLIGGTSGNIRVQNCIVSGGNADIEIATGGSTYVGIDGTAFLGATAGVLVSTVSAKVTVTNCPTLANQASPTPFTLSSAPAYLAQSGNNIPVNLITVAVGATSGAPDWSKGWTQRIAATSGGAGTVTVPAPTPAAAFEDTLLTIYFKNAAGGTVTWSLNAAYHLAGGAAPAGTDGTTTMVVFKYDVAGTVWREVTRANSTT